MPNHFLCDQLYVRISILVHTSMVSSNVKTNLLQKQMVLNLVLCVRLFLKVNVNAIAGSLGPWQALRKNPKERNASKDGFVNISQ